MSTESDALIEAVKEVGVCQPVASLDVSDDLQNAIPDVDLENEERIEMCRRNMEAAYQHYQQTSDVRHRQDSTYWRIEWERAIARRSPQQVARMQAAQNARMAVEPGATHPENA
jgi:uncharacterized membrane protein YccC